MLTDDVCYCPQCEGQQKHTYYSDKWGKTVGEAAKDIAPAKFDVFLQRMKAMHDKKRADYASDQNPFSNFENAAKTANCSVDQVFKTMIGIKLARINELQGSAKTPNNESLDDSILDLAVYATLWGSYRS